MRLKPARRTPDIRHETLRRHQIFDAVVVIVVLDVVLVLVVLVLVIAGVFLLAPARGILWPPRGDDDDGDGPQRRR